MSKNVHCDGVAVDNHYDSVMMKMVVMAMGDGGWMVVSFRW